MMLKQNHYTAPSTPAYDLDASSSFSSSILSRLDITSFQRESSSSAIPDTYSRDHYYRTQPTDRPSPFQIVDRRHRRSSDNVLFTEIRSCRAGSSQREGRKRRRHFSERNSSPTSQLSPAIGNSHSSADLPPATPREQQSIIDPSLKTSPPTVTTFTNYNYTQTDESRVRSMELDQSLKPSLLFETWNSEKIMPREHWHKLATASNIPSCSKNYVDATVSSNLDSRSQSRTIYRSASPANTFSSQRIILTRPDSNIQIKSLDDAPTGRQTSSRTFAASTKRTLNYWKSSVISELDSAIHLILGSVSFDWCFRLPSVPNFPSFFLTFFLLLATFLPQIEACSTRPSPKPRPPRPYWQPDNLSPKFNCTQDYAELYCLNNGSCYMQLSVYETPTPFCECTKNFYGKRCEYKEFIEKYLPTIQHRRIETAAISASVAFLIVVLAICALSVYVYQKRQKHSGSVYDYDSPDGIESLPDRPFSIRRHNQIRMIRRQNPYDSSSTTTGPSQRQTVESEPSPLPCPAGGQQAVVEHQPPHSGRAPIATIDSLDDEERNTAV